jgi:hypothetical protein
MKGTSGDTTRLITPVSIFVGSSTESLPIAQQVQVELGPTARAKVWNQGIFKLGEGGLESLVGELGRHDFAILVFSADDVTSSRDRDSASPRDNVVFELGLFMGRLGPKRTFVLYDRTADLKILSDLAGITLAPYDGKWAKTDIGAAIGAACNPIRQAIRVAGPAQKTVAQVQSPTFLLASAMKFERSFITEEAAVVESGISTPETEAHLSADRLRFLLSSRRYDIVQLTVDVSSDGSIGFFDSKELSADLGSNRIPAEGLVKLLETSGTTLLVLAGCNSVPLAARLSSRINMVAASGNLLVDPFAEWSRIFYRLLATGRPLSQAFELARSTVDLPLSIILHQDINYIS